MKLERDISTLTALASASLLMLVVTSCGSSSTNSSSLESTAVAQSTPVEPVSEHADQIGELVARALEEGPIAGIAVAVTLGDKTIVSSGYGDAVLVGHLPVTPATVFRIGSVTKQFTAVAILQLVDAGTINLDASITEFLPDYPMHGATITVRNLLNHTSGIKSYTGLAVWKEAETEDKSTTQMLELFKELPLEFPPGQRFSYSNSGYFLLGVLIEKVSGMSYADYLSEHILSPVGLANTSYCSEEDSMPNRAQGYRRDDKQLKDDKPLSMTQPFSAGALCSTANDLAKWREALEEGKLLKPATKKIMESSSTLGDGSATGYGLGFFLGELGDHPIVSHGGAINGFSSQASYYPNDDLTIVVLSNTEGASVSRLEQSIARLVLEIPEPTIKDLPVPAEEVSRYLGSYRLEGLGDMVIRQSEGKLLSKLATQPELPILFQGNHEFVPDLTALGVPADASIRLTFQFEDAYGRRAKSLVITQGGKKLSLARSE